jgi:phytanoyl-CoA hydroxylase
VQPGDAVLHNVLTLHSAPETTGSERRVVYYEYRPAEVEIALGPHSADYVAEKQRVLRACLEERRASPVAEGETAFAYAPPAELERWREASPDGGFRVAHSDYWTWPDVEPEPR